MPAYIIAQVEIHDEAAYAEYRRLVPASVAQYGGRFAVRGGAIETLEGKWHPQRLVVLEFDSAVRAKQWLNSPEYAHAKGLRHAAAHTEMIVVEGVALP